MPYKDTKKKAANQVKYRSNHRKDLATYDAAYRSNLKLYILTHYGPEGTLGCCWEGCMVADLDMLSIDHINDEGSKHILPGNVQRLAGGRLYNWLKFNNFPEGFQTLCWNHQWKKRCEKFRREKEYLTNNLTSQSLAALGQGRDAAVSASHPYLTETIQ